MALLAGTLFMLNFLNMQNHDLGGQSNVRTTFAFVWRVKPVNFMHNSRREIPIENILILLGGQKKDLVVHLGIIYIVVALGCRMEMTLFLCGSAPI